VLAVSVDYEKRLAVVGTDTDQRVPREEILRSLKAIGYTGEFEDHRPNSAQVIP
jgi:hypothetical protein